MAEITTDTKMPVLTSGVPPETGYTPLQGPPDNSTAWDTPNKGEYGVGEQIIGLVGVCQAHHGPDPDGFASIDYEIAIGEEISHFHANTLKFALSSLSKSFNRGITTPNYTKIYSTPPTFTTATTGNVARYVEWNQLRNTLIQFGAVTLPLIDTNTTIESSFFNQLRAEYDHYRGLCLCNSDCSCNAVCTCNSDCGCNYG